MSVYEGLRREDREVKIISKPYLHLWQMDCERNSLEGSGFTIKILKFI